MRAWNHVFQVLKEKNCQLRLLCPANLSFLIEEVVKTFHDKQKLKQFMTTKPALQRILKGILHTEEEDKHNHKNMGKNKFSETSR
jgi:hypothetical protein